jgi:hypothetical protein
VFLFSRAEKMESDSNPSTRSVNIWRDLIPKDIRCWARRVFQKEGISATRNINVNSSRQDPSDPFQRGERIHYFIYLPMA